MWTLAADAARAHEAAFHGAVAAENTLVAFALIARHGDISWLGRHARVGVEARVEFRTFVDANFRGVFRFEPKRRLNGDLRVFALDADCRTRRAFCVLGVRVVHVGGAARARSAVVVCKLTVGADCAVDGTCASDGANGTWSTAYAASAAVDDFACPCVTRHAKHAELITNFSRWTRCARGGIVNETRDGVGWTLRACRAAGEGSDITKPTWGALVATPRVCSKATRGTVSAALAAQRHLTRAARGRPFQLAFSLVFGRFIVSCTI